MKKVAVVVTAVCLGLGAIPASASDHIDGLATSVDNAADLTDAFAFVSPSDPSKLVVALAVSPATLAGHMFSDAVDYEIRIRPVTDATTLAPSSDASQETTILCDFSGGVLILSTNQQATCSVKYPGGMEDDVTFETRMDDFDHGGSGQTGSTQIFAGERSDPWFLDLGKTLAYGNGVHFSESLPGVNGLYKANVLAIVAELDASRLPGTMLAVAAQTVRKQ